MEKDIIKFADWQARELKNGLLALLAAVRLGAEEVRASKAARIVCWVILAGLSLTLWTIVTFRVAQRDAEENFNEWRERYVNDFLAQQEAAEKGMPMDPREELRKQENTEFAKLIEGLKNYNYGFEDWMTLGQCVKNRELNPTKPGSIVEVIQEGGQWPGYSENNEVTAAKYKLAAEVMDAIRSQEFQPCDKSLIIAEFGERITLRNTMDYNRNTVTWRYGE